MLISSSPFLQGNEQAICMVIADLTQVKQAEQELEKAYGELEERIRERTRELASSEERFRAILENSLDGILLTIPETGAIVDANPAALDLFGMTKEELLKTGRADLLVQTPALENAVTKRNRDGKWRGELTYRRSDGSTFPGEISSSLFSGSDGIAMSSIIIRDITERKKSEAALRESEQRFRLALKNAPVSVAVQDRDLRYVWAYNQRTAPPEAIVGKLDSEIFTPEEAEKITALKRRVLEEDRELREQMWLDRPSERIFLDVYWEPIHDKDGKVIGVGSATVELTPLKQAEEELGRARDELEHRVEERTAELRQSEQLALRTLKEMNSYYDAYPIGLCALDINMRYLRINQRLADLNGVPRSEHIGRTIRDVLPVALADQLEPFLRQAIETGEPIRDIELTSPVPSNPSETAIWLLTFNPFRDDEGRVIGVTAAVQDITKFRQIEEQLRQSHKMEALGTLTGGIAHDFNNILAGMIGFTEMAMEDASMDDLHYSLERILQAGLRGRDLVRQMLTFSRKTEYDVKALSITPLIEETLRLLRATIPTTIQIKFMTTAKKDIVHANATGIQQILMNLATNAAHAMRDSGGTLNVSLSDAYDESSPFIALTVRDTGTGMPPEVAKRIFEPFFTTKVAGQGTGMGLSVVYGIVRSFGGDISVHSTPGQGTVFQIYFPRATTEESIEAAAAMKLPKGNEKILFVDDEETLIDLGKRMLERLGYHVTATTSSAEALKIFADDPTHFNLVITDQTMPELTGLRLAGELLRLRPDLPIILCTGFSESLDSEKVKAAGVRGFAMKPLTRKELAKTVRNVLDEKDSL